MAFWFAGGKRCGSDTPRVGGTGCVLGGIGGKWLAVSDCDCKWKRVAHLHRRRNRFVAEGQPASLRPDRDAERRNGGRSGPRLSADAVEIARNRLDCLRNSSNVFRSAVG